MELIAQITGLIIGTIGSITLMTLLIVLFYKLYKKELIKVEKQTIKDEKITEYLEMLTKDKKENK